MFDSFDDTRSLPRSVCVLFVVPQNDGYFLKFSVSCHCEGFARGSPVFIHSFDNISNLDHLAINVPTVGNSSFPPFALCSVVAGLPHSAYAPFVMTMNPFCHSEPLGEESIYQCQNRFFGLFSLRSQ